MSIVRKPKLSYVAGSCMPAILLTACGGGSGGVATYAVSASAGNGGSISPSSTMVQAGSTASFTVTPSSGYVISSVTGCGGSLSGSTYTSGTIDSPCTVTASFAAMEKVTATAGTGGKISPASATVNPGAARR